MCIDGGREAITRRTLGRGFIQVRYDARCTP